MPDFHDPVQPPRLDPDRFQGGDPRPEGWQLIITGPDPDHGGERVLAGRTDDGVFHQYASTEAIVDAMVEAITLWRERSMPETLPAGFIPAEAATDAPT